MGKFHKEVDQCAGSGSFGTWEMAGGVPGELALTVSLEWIVLDPSPILQTKRQKVFCRNFTKGLSNT